MANSSGVLLAPGIRAVSTQSTQQSNSSWRGVMLYFDVTAAPGAETLSPQIEARNPATGEWEPITAFPVITAPFSAEKVYIVYPGAVKGAAMVDQEVAGIPLPQQWRLNVGHSAGGNWNYSVGFHLIQ